MDILILSIQPETITVDITAHILPLMTEWKNCLLENSKLPNKPDPGYNNYDYLMKALPINADNEACLDFISVTDAGWENNQNETSNYFFTVINTNCNF